jgi:hypothetical protein
MSTPTPRTNRAWNTLGDDNAEVAWSFARTLERELAREREKVRELRLTCERIVNQWDENHDCNPIGAGSTMYTLASKVLAATE